MKDKIRKLALEMGVDDIGFAAPSKYHSPRSPKVETIFPEIKTIIVLAYKELSSCESINMQIAMNGRLDVMEFSRSCNYKLARFLEKEYKAKAMTVSVSYPLEMSYRTKGCVGDVSLRHAAVAAGLGTFGRHNLVIHPQLGTRVIFTAVLCNLDITPDSEIEHSLCNNCNICVQSCPAGALNKEGKTAILRCIRNLQPYGIGSVGQFWEKFAGSSLEEQKSMVKSEHFWRLYQAGSIGFQYFCFQCLAKCPAMRKD